MFGTMNWLRLPLFITILFAMLVAVPFEGAGSRGRALAAVFEAIRHAFVEPMTMPGAVLFVFAVSAFFSLVLGRGGQQIAENDVEEPPPVPKSPPHLPMATPSPKATASVRKAFGKKPERLSRQSKAMGKHAEDARRVLSFKGLDYFLSEHGFEQRWKLAVRELEAAGDHKLAIALQAAGEIFDRWESVRTSREAGELTQAEINSCFAELRPCGDRISTLLKA